MAKVGRIERCIFFYALFLTAFLCFWLSPACAQDYPDQYQMVSAGTDFSLAVATDGTVWSWGRNSSGELGDGTTDDRYYPQQVEGLPEIVSVSAGREYSLAVAADGTVWSWGCNSYGQLGIDEPSDGPFTTPRQVLHITNAVAVSAGGRHAHALLDDGTMMSWGNDQYGTLGTGQKEYGYSIELAPVPIPDLSGIVQISTGSRFSLALNENGRVWSWGSAVVGQLGIGWPSCPGANVMVPAPQLIPNLNNVVEIQAGSAHSMALLGDGTVWSWGWNGHGQLGDPSVPTLPSSGTTICRSRPIQVPGLSDVKSIGVGGDMSMVSFSEDLTLHPGLSHTLALQSDNTLWAWGSNRYGALGDGTTHPGSRVNLRSSPFRVMPSPASPEEFQAVSLDEDLIRLSWEKKSEQDDVLVLYSLDGLYAVPVPGTDYEPGDLLPPATGEGEVLVWGRNVFSFVRGFLGDGTESHQNTPVPLHGGGIVLYQGPLAEFDHTGLESGQAYDYQLRSRCPDGAYSPPVSASAYTSKPIRSFPWTETFDDNSPSRPAWNDIRSEYTWARMDFGPGSNDSFLQEALLGEKNLLVENSLCMNLCAITLVTPLLDTTALEDPRLIFWYNMAVIRQNWDYYVNELNIYYRTGPEEDWESLGPTLRGTGNSTWRQMIFPLPETSASFQIAFEMVRGGGYTLLLDAVRVDGSNTPGSTVGVSIEPPEALESLMNDNQVKWRMHGDGPLEKLFLDSSWQHHQATLQVDPGVYTVEFEQHSWTTPSYMLAPRSFQIVVTEGETLQVAGIYGEPVRADPPTPLYPEPGAIVSGPSIGFMWEDDPYAQHYILRIRYADTGNLFYRRNVNAEENVHTVGCLETGRYNTFPDDGTVFEWMVKSERAFGLRSDEIWHTFTSGVPTHWDVTYDDNEATVGTVPIDGNCYEEGAIVTVLGNTGNLERTGYTFADWNTAADGSGIDYAADSTFTMETADVILFAQWSINQYTVTFDSTGGITVTNQEIEHGEVATEPAEPTREGHSFDGWYSDVSLTNAYDFSTSVTADITLYARWVANEIDECFIATAAYGSKLAAGVAILRQFRDAKLLTNLPGQAFVSFYYQMSPPIAEYIAGNSLLKALLRTMLLPVIAVAYMLMHFWLMPIAVSIAIMAIYYRRQILRAGEPPTLVGHHVLP